MFRHFLRIRPEFWTDQVGLTHESFGSNWVVNHCHPFFESSQFWLLLFFGDFETTIFWGQTLTLWPPPGRSLSSAPTSRPKTEAIRWANSDPTGGELSTIKVWAYDPQMWEKIWYEHVLASPDFLFFSRHQVESLWNQWEETGFSVRRSLWEEVIDGQNAATRLSSILGSNWCSESTDKSLHILFWEKMTTTPSILTYGLEAIHTSGGRGQGACSSKKSSSWRCFIENSTDFEHICSQPVLRLGLTLSDIYTLVSAPGTGNANWTYFDKKVGLIIEAAPSYSNLCICWHFTTTICHHHIQNLFSAEYHRFFHHAIMSTLATPRQVIQRHIIFFGPIETCHRVHSHS